MNAVAALPAQPVVPEAPTPAAVKCDGGTTNFENLLNSGEPQPQFTTENVAEEIPSNPESATVVDPANSAEPDVTDAMIEVAALYALLPLVLPPPPQQIQTGDQTVAESMQLLNEAPGACHSEEKNVSEPIRDGLPSVRRLRDRSFTATPRDPSTSLRFARDDGAVVVAPENTVTNQQPLEKGERGAFDSRVQQTPAELPGAKALTANVETISAEVAAPLPSAKAVVEPSSEAAGIAAAMHQPEMQPTVKEPQLFAKSANPAVGAQTPAVTAQTVESAQRAMPVSGRREAREEQRGTFSFGDNQTAPVAASRDAVFTTATDFSLPATETKSAPLASEAANISRRVMDIADQVRLTGREHVEVRIPLENGQELTVRLQAAAGEVKPIFRTDSDALRQALERSWPQFSTAANERGLQIANPVFESPRAQAGMSDWNQQQRGGRAFTTPEQEANFAPFHPRGKASQKAAKPVTTQLSGVYA